MGSAKHQEFRGTLSLTLALVNLCRPSLIPNSQKAYLRFLGRVLEASGRDSEDCVHAARLGLHIDNWQTTFRCALEPRLTKGPLSGWHWKEQCHIPVFLLARDAAQPLSALRARNLPAEGVQTVCHCHQIVASRSFRVASQMIFYKKQKGKKGAESLPTPT